MRNFRFDRMAERAAAKVDKFIGIFSPKTMVQRKAYRFTYEAIERGRLNKKRNYIADATEDSLMSEFDLAAMRLIGRDMSRNNPIAVGMLDTEADEVIGSVLQIKANLGDEKLEDEIEAAWKEEMLQSPVDVTGQWNLLQLLRMMFVSYRRDGDCGCLFTDDGLQVIEGDRIGTPMGGKQPEKYEIINGVAYSKLTQRLLGYFVGKPTKYGYIETGSYQQYDAEDMHMMYWPMRVSQSRGIPALTASVKFMDHLHGYLEAELVAARVNACNCMFISQEAGELPDAFVNGNCPNGVTEDGDRPQKMEPGSILYGRPGEDAKGIMQTRPGNMFDVYINKMLGFAARPLCLPLMLVTLDFAGATYMNARIANQVAQENWLRQQEFVIKPFVRKVYNRWLAKRFSGVKTTATILCRRWPYVDPSKEAAADKVDLLETKITSPQAICSRRGDDYEDVVKQRKAAGLDNDEVKKDDKE